MRTISGYVTVSEHLLRPLREIDQIFEDIQAGRRGWDPDAVDWDAYEAMHEDD